ncbi:MAG: TrkA family potassium uptake protein [Candidatus Aminicenantes bacterium]|nr:TrkA family potassium uptake protein [Candidatus Aminicenantes bacterium]NIM78991.1 TrkA family potassium uptake protein [Candidatus Aminicenantes bacterium]NIN18249.1 TrkA family potassium uptake protein [Candidatus Aminicenantes bacterium]NIN42146.1 TrkA family potassium uptake protein [Candidatus Aminicenantes bacterium]NIN84902.1 TrkA family potassium uptake protein [Candidatus Aminicenantes bacterium]
MKRVAVIGLGSFGTHLVKTLAKKDIEIIAIDTDENRVNEIKDFVTQPVTTDATIKENLVSLGVADLDYVVVSSGPSLEPSILTVYILKELGVPRIAAKALSEDHEKILRMVGATDIVYPERDAAQKLGNQIDSPTLIDYLPLELGFVLQEIAVPDAFIGKTLNAIDLRKKYKVTVLAIKSIIPDVTSINPAGDVVLKESDILIVFGKNEDIENLHKKTKG